MKNIKLPPPPPARRVYNPPLLNDNFIHIFIIIGSLINGVILIFFAEIVKDYLNLFIAFLLITQSIVFFLKLQKRRLKQKIKKAKKELKEIMPDDFNDHLSPFEKRRIDYLKNIINERR